MNEATHLRANASQEERFPSVAMSQADWIGRWPLGEPKLTEALAEPIVQALMARDGVDEATLLSLTALHRRC
jgi:hypothetical protein